MHPRLIPFVFLLLIGVVAPAAETKPRRLLAGAATSNITPEIGAIVVGGFNPFPATHIHDELHARCLVLDNGEKRIAVVVCDSLGAARQMYDLAARLVQAETGIPRECLLMSATHTHSAARALGVNGYSTKPDEMEDYQRFVARRIADGVKRAINNLAPARIGWAVASEPRHVFNRRWFKKEGTIPANPFGGQDRVKMNPGHSADLVRPAGPIDPEVCLVSVQSLAGKPLAVMANYSLHYVGDVGTGHISADYFAVFCDRLQQLLGADRQDPAFVAMLSNGTSGNINNVDFSKPYQAAGPKYSRIRQVAHDVAQVSFEALQGVTYQDWVPLDARFRDLKLVARRPSPELVRRAEELVKKPRLIKGRPDMEVAYAERTLRLRDAGPMLDIPVQALRIGGVGIAAIPAETFVETGLELKAKSPFKPSFTHSIANGYFGYLPTPEHHQLGGYETWLGTNRLEEQASVKITDALLAMWNEMR
jgi:hypothetical protein